LDAEYALMKQVMNNHLRRWTGARPRRIHFPCVGGDPEFHSKNEMITAIGVLAAEIVQANRILRWAQYPASVWESRLRDVERQELDAIRRSGKFDEKFFDVDKVTNALASYRAVNPDLPEISWEPACGGTEQITVEIVTRPPGRNVKTIAALYYSFCKAQDIDPKKFKECDLWNNVRHGEKADFLGAYWYQVERDDGSYTEPKRKDFNESSPNMKRWVVN
jgi:hypothetical protein